jgi:hypothetical protein
MQLLKNRLKLDDVLDVTSLQAIPGAVGSILVGFFADSNSQPCDTDGPEFAGQACRADLSHYDGILYNGDGELLKWQVIAVVCQIVWTAFFTFVTMKIIEVCNLIALRKVHTFSLFQVRGLDVPSEYEHIGLDRSEHGEKGCVVLVAAPCLNRSVLPSLSFNSQSRALHASVCTYALTLCTSRNTFVRTSLSRTGTTLTFTTKRTRQSWRPSCVRLQRSVT